MAVTFAERGDTYQIEHGLEFAPKFDADGLIPAIAVDAQSGDVLMFAYMNADTLASTIATGVAHYWSRSRKQVWRKGASSGNEQMVRELRVDCDQDVVLLKVEVAGHGASCHTGHRSCFYRRVVMDEGAGEAPPDGSNSSPPALVPCGGERLFDPEDVYGSS